MTTRVWAGVLCLAAGLVSAAASVDDPALDKLEAALSAKPDDLRAANDYRMAVVQINKLPEYDRAIAFFQKLVTDHPDAANAHLNYGFAYVDKIEIRWPSGLRQTLTGVPVDRITHVIEGKP